MMNPEGTTLPPSFQFSQGSLQDYVDCPRRFQLRFVRGQPWPALVTGSPAEEELHRQRAADLHHLLHQHALGIDVQPHALRDPIVAQWWHAYQRRPPSGMPCALRMPEVVLSMPVGGHRLVGRFDLLAVEPGKQAVIVDWKTPLRRPSRPALARRLQTRAYRFLAVEAGAALAAGESIRPEQVEMVYWYATFGGDTDRFPYDGEQHDADRHYLQGLVAEIAGMDRAVWPLTLDECHCRFCNYRSLCKRGVTAGPLEELEEDLEGMLREIDLEQIAEMAF